jgi:hypothetical protein
MKVKSILFFLMTCVVLISSCFDCHAQSSTSLDLINNAKQYDNKTVDYKGEAIGDVMVRGDHAWVHVNDGISALGIWAPRTMIDYIHFVGDYRTKGDIVEVTGVFHRACPEHGGDLDIHASEIKKITAGSLLIQPVSRKKVRIGTYSIILVVLFLAANKIFTSKNRF